MRSDTSALRAFDDDIDVPTTRPELPPTLSERYRQSASTARYRLTEVPPWAHRPVALTVLCAVIAATSVTVGSYLVRVWEQRRAVASPTMIQEPPGVLIGLASGLASRSEIRPPAQPPASSVNVHVAGEVHSHGMVTLPAGSRAVDAIKAAGGATDHADLDQVNLARELVDGDQVLVPLIPPPETVSPPTDSTTPTPDPALEADGPETG